MDGISFRDIKNSKDDEDYEIVFVMNDFIFLILSRKKYPLLKREQGSPYFARAYLRWNSINPTIRRIERLTTSEIEKNKLGEIKIEGNKVFITLKLDQNRYNDSVILHRTYGVIEDPYSLVPDLMSPKIVMTFPIHQEPVIYEIVENCSRDKFDFNEKEAEFIIRKLFDSKEIARSIMLEDEALATRIIDKMFKVS